MTYEEAKTEQNRLLDLGIHSRISIVIFGKTEDEHVYAVTTCL